MVSPDSARPRTTIEHVCLPSASRVATASYLQAFAILVNDSHASQPLGGKPLSWTDCEGLRMRLCFDVRRREGMEE
jgi:hypothetical protein